MLLIYTGHKLTGADTRRAEDGSADAVAASEAGLLFATPAGAVNPAFEVTAHNSAAIAVLCARLDGMPLAIELAVARSPALDPEQLAARLDGRPGPLAATGRQAGLTGSLLMTSGCWPPRTAPSAAWRP